LFLGEKKGEDTFLGSRGPFFQERLRGEGEKKGKRGEPAKGGTPFKKKDTAFQKKGGLAFSRGE